MRPTSLSSILLVFASGCSSPPEVMAGHEEPFHRIRIQNENVRVIDVQIPPGAATAFHTHPIDAAVVFLTCANIQIEKLDGTVTNSTVARGGVDFGPSAAIHRARCTGDSPFRAMAVELLVAPSTGPGTTPEARIPGGEILLENDHVRMIKLRLPSGQSLESDTGVPVVMVAMGRGSLSLSNQPTEKAGVGDVWWRGDGKLQLQNRGDTAFDAIAIQILPR